MPTPEQILDGATTIANDSFALAVAWHAVIAMAVIALLIGWRPSRRLAALLLSLPALSVGIISLAYANPFNGTIFVAVAAGLVAIGASLDSKQVQRASGWSSVAGISMVLFGWAYPHFLLEQPALAYLYGAPTGLVPCPTLSLMIGFALLAGGFGSRAWSLTLATAGLLYGVFGAVRLGVTIDAVLIVGALCLALVAVLPGERRRLAKVTHIAEPQV